MDKLLSQYAKEKGLGYHNLWRKFDRGELKDAYKDDNGSIRMKTSLASEITEKSLTWANMAQPIEVVTASDGKNYETSRGSTRRNATTASPKILDRFKNIQESFIPYSDSNATNDSGLNIKDIVILTQKSYFNFGSVSQVINVMTEFSSSSIYLRGGSKRSRDFFTSYFEAINLNNFTLKFFREYYRSGNVFIYPLKGALKKENVISLIKNLELKISTAKKVEIPVKYVILNPADITVTGSTTFLDATYNKVLNAYEVSRLKNPQTPQDQAIFNALPDKVKEEIKGQKSRKSGSQQLEIPLDSDEIYAIFYNKQDYEPFAVSLIFPVLDDLEWKQELKNIDKQISRTISQAVLLVRLGYEDKNGNYQYNQAIADSYRTMFENQSVSRVIIGDFTVDAKFVIPDIADILTPEKYQVVNEDIRAGLCDIIFGGASEKFANQSIKVQVFIERLKKARQVFINDFLYPEMQKISKEMGLKGECPKPHFYDINLKDDLQWGRIYAQLAQLGVLTPSETIDAIETGVLPDKEASNENQKEFRQKRDDGLYEPIMGGPNTQLKLNEQKAQNDILKINGRPPGTKTPQSTKKISPIGTSKASEDNNNEYYFSQTKIYNNLVLAHDIERHIEKSLCKKFKIKELNLDQESIVSEIKELVIANEEPAEWMNNIQKYIDNPVDSNAERIKEINQLAYKHQVDLSTAAILFVSKTDKLPKN